MKKGQITSFVILGIIIVAVIALAIYYNTSLSKPELELAERAALSSEEKDIAKLMDSCVEKTLKDAILKVSMNGGYYPARDGSTSIEDYRVPLYLDKGEENTPSITDLSTGIALYIDENIAKCFVEELEVLGPPSTVVHVENTVKAEVTMLTRVKNSKINKFYAELNIDLGKILDDVKAFYSKVKVYNYTINLMDFNDMAIAANYKFDFTTEEDKSLFFMIWESYINGEDLTFTFGIRKEPFEEVPETISVIDEYIGEDLPADLQDPKDEDYEGVDYESIEANEAGEEFGEL